MSSLHGEVLHDDVPDKVVVSDSQQKLPAV